MGFGGAFAAVCLLAPVVFAQNPASGTLEVGINIGAYDASFFDVGLISAFDDKAGFLRYIQYPEHDAVVAFITSVTADEQIVDFET